MAVQEFFDKLNGGARWDVGVSINRSNSLPLDANSVFSSLEAAQNYAAGTPAEGTLANAYPGQVLAVVTDAETVIYYIDANKQLQPVGNTKEVMEYIGVIPEEYNVETIIDYINAKTAGIASDAELSALQATVSALDTLVSGKAATSETEAVEGLVDKVDAHTQAIQDLNAADVQVLADAKTYTDEEITGLTVAIEKKDSVEHIIIKNKAGEEVASVNASTFVQDSFLNDVAYDAEAGEITFVWTMGDGSTKTDAIKVADFVQTYTNGTGLTLTGNEFAINTDVIATVEALNAVSAVAEAAQTAQEVADAIDAKIAAENLSQYATNDTVAELLEPKANTADVVANEIFETFKTANDEAIAAKLAVADYNTDKATFATKTELAGKVDNAALNAYYTKTDIDNADYAIAAIVAATYSTKDELAIVTQTASNAATKADSLETRLNDIVNKGGEPNAINTVKVNGTALVIDEQKAVDITVPTAITDLTDGQTVLDNITAVASAASKVAEDLDTAVKALQDKDEEIVTLIQTAYSTTTEVEAKIAAELAPYAKSADIEAELALKANIADVYTKEAADDAFMTEADVDTRINALIVAADPEGGKTISNIQNLVKYVDENAGEITALVSTSNDTAAKLTGINTTVIDAINAAVATVVTPKASDEITVQDNGVLGIGKVSIAKLDQGDCTLVLNGGAAV